MNRIRKNMLTIVPTETLLRKWQRRLIVALTDSEKQKCKFYIKMYKVGG